MAGGTARRRTLAAAFVGLVVTAAVLLVPDLRFAYRSEGAHLVLETTVTLAAGLAALLVYGRYRRSGAVSELLLVYALSLLSLTALLLVTLPVLLGEDLGRTASSWAAVVVRLVGGLLLAAAALARPDRTYRPAHPLRDAAVVAVGLVAVSSVVLMLASGLPDAVRVTVSPEASGRPSFDGHPVVLLAQVVNLACYSLAAVVLTSRAAQRGDELLGWFGAACALGAWARVDYLLFPSLYTSWVYVGDLLRLGFYLLLIVGAVREIGAYWEAQAAMAVQGERRRLARDLHDGVVQELGWIRTTLVKRSPSDPVAAAADRALAESRRAVTALATDTSETLADALRAAVDEVGDRYDVPVRTSLDDAVSVTSRHREELVRVAREAVTNAARHSGATVIHVTLEPGRITVRDDGCGFDASARRPDRFGLTSMRERAEALGGALRVVAAQGKGTCVEVTW